MSVGIYHYTIQAIGKPVRGPGSAQEVRRHLEDLDNLILPLHFIIDGPFTNDEKIIVVPVAERRFTTIVVKRSMDRNMLKNHRKMVNYNMRYKILSETPTLFANGGFWTVTSYTSNNQPVYQRVEGFHLVRRQIGLHNFVHSRYVWFGPARMAPDNEWRAFIHHLLTIYPPGPFNTQSIFRYVDTEDGTSTWTTWKWRRHHPVDEVLDRAYDSRDLQNMLVQDAEEESWHYERRIPEEEVELDTGVIAMNYYGGLGGAGGLSAKSKRNKLQWYIVDEVSSRKYGLGDADCLFTSILDQIPPSKIPDYNVIRNYRELWFQELDNTRYMSINDIGIIEDMLRVNVVVYADEIIAEREYVETSSLPILRPGNWKHYIYQDSIKRYDFTVEVVLHNEHFYKLISKNDVAFSPIAAMPYVKTSNDKFLPSKKAEIEFLMQLASSNNTQSSMALTVLQKRKIPGFVGVKKNDALEGRLYPVFRKFKNVLGQWCKSNNVDISTIKPNQIPDSVYEDGKYESLIYDVETIYDPQAKCVCKPYSLSYVILEHDAKTGLPIFDFRGKEGEWKQKTVFVTGSDCFDSLFDELLNNERRAKILVGFNSSRFDNFLLVDELIKRGYHPELFYAQNAILNIKVGGCSSFDVFNFVRCKLSFACKSYKTYPEKMEGFDHSVPQNKFHDGGWNNLMDWAEDNEMLEKYNKLDVLSLADLYVKLAAAIQRPLGPLIRVYDYLTIGSLSYSIWKNLNEEEYSKIAEDDDPRSLGKISWNTRRKYENADISVLGKFYYEDDKEMRKAITAGRVQIYQKGGIPQIHNTELAMYDVKSLYPFAMRHNDYPNGLMWKTDTEMTALLGVYRCTVHSQPAVRVVPKRIKGQPLDWHIKDNQPFERWLVTPDIETIRRYGGTVEVHEGYVFSGRGKVFEVYVSKFESLKNEQDALNAARHPSYNPALREMYKLLLNNLSGKVLQRVFLDKSKLCYRAKEAQKFLASLDAYSVEFGIINGAVLLSGKAAETPKFANMPSIYGMYIYSYARNYMYDILFSKYTVLYGDTDSALLPLEEAKRVREEQPELFADLSNRAMRFGDLEEEVIVHENGNSYPATCAVLLRPKAYMVYNPKGKSKMKLKGIGSNDRFLETPEAVTIVHKLIKKEKYADLDELYKTGKCRQVDLTTQEGKTCRERQVFMDMFNKRQGYFLCWGMLRKRVFSKEDCSPVAFNVSQRYLLKKLVFPTSNGDVEEDIVTDEEIENIYYSEQDEQDVQMLIDISTIS